MIASQSAWAWPLPLIVAFAHPTRPFAFFQGCAALNGREILGTARTIAGSKYIGVKCQDVLFLEFAKCLARHRWQHCSDDFLAVLKEVMDPLLCRLYQRLAKNGVKEETFVETYGPVISLPDPRGTFAGSCELPASVWQSHGRGQESHFFVILG